MLKASEWLAGRPANQNLLQKVKVNIKLNAAIRQLIGDQLSQYVQVIKIEDEVLHIAAANQACASRLRQLQPSILEAVRAKRMAVRSMRIRVMLSLNS